MKKLIILLLILSGGVLHTFGQVPKLTVTPGEIDALTENVTFTFDVTGTDVEGLTDIYIWAWSSDIGSPSEMLLCYDGGNASWGNISPNAKLEPVDSNPNLFTITLPKTVTRDDGEVTFKNVADLFGVSATPGKIKEFGFLLRSQDGSQQTPGDMQSKVTLKALIFEENIFRTFPASVSNKDVVTVYFNQNLADDAKQEIMTDVKVSVTLTDESGDVIIAHAEPVATTPERDGEFSYSFLPSMLGTFPDGVTLDDVKNMEVVFSGILNKPDGTTETVTSSTFEQVFSDYE